jgi:hypothetical protein
MFIDKSTQTNGPHQTLNITGLACAKGYTGKPKPMCTKAAGTYSVSGCTKVSTYKKVQPTYKLMPAADGRCNDDASLISSFDDCQAALNAIKKKRNDVRNTVPAVLRNVPLLPRGCFFKPLSGYVFWNAQGSAGGGSYNVPHQAICKTASTCKVSNSMAALSDRHTKPPSPNGHQRPARLTPAGRVRFR